MNLFKSCFRTVLVFLAVILVSVVLVNAPTGSLAEPSESEPPASFDTEFIRTRVFPSAGRVSVSFRESNGRVFDELMLPPVTLDGAAQTGFRASDAVAGVFLNDKVEMSVQPLGPRAVALMWSARDGAVHTFSARIPDNSGYYGGGERFQALNQKGYVLPMMNIDRPEDKGTVSYKPVPFFMSTRGYGFWINSFSPGSVDLNATDRSNIILRYPEDRFMLVFFAGPEMSDILESYTALSGRPPVPPAWSFAPWKSRDVHKNREEILQDVELTRKHNLPGSVLVIDSPWETGYNNFHINTRQFSDPKSMFERIDELGFYTCLWLTPFVNSRNNTDMAGISSGASSNFQEAADSGYLVKTPKGDVMISGWWKGEGGLVDFTNPAAVDWWHSQLDLTRQWGVRAFKCDDGEGNFVLDAMFRDGTSAQKMRNRYAFLYLKTMHEYIQERLNGDGVLFARAGFAGTQSFPFCWSGDNAADFSFTNGLPTAILAGQTAALSGISMWGHDIAGYQGRPSKELFIRWTQFGALSPLMQIHMTSNLGPWDFDEETLGIYRKFARLHTTLYPYIHEAALESNRAGMPIIRPMVLAFQKDPVAAQHIYQYMFGHDLLAAPMYQGGNYRTVYLPEGSWIDYWSGKEFAGKQVIEVHAPIEIMPLFVRAGAVMSCLPEDVQTLIPRHPKMSPEVIAMDDRRVVQVWPGSSREMETSDGLKIHSQPKNGHGKITVSSSTPRPLEIHLMRRNIEGVESSAAPLTSFGFDEQKNATVCRWDRFQGQTTLSW